jgi:single-strand DNA-binding protein
MGSVNKIILVGNLGRDAELRYTPSGDAVLNFSLATTEVWNDKQGQRQEHTQWFRVDFWGKRGERIQEYLKRGQRVYVDGRLRLRDYEDRDGNKRISADVRANDVVLLGGRREGAGEAAPGGRSDRFEGHSPAQATTGNQPGNGGSAELSEDDIPF